MIEEPKPVQKLLMSLLSGMRWTFLHKAIAAGAGFAISVLSARLLGTEGYGALQYVLGVMQFLLVFGAFGLNQIIVRETAIATSNNAWSRSKGLMMFTLPTIAILTTVGALLSTVFVVSALQSNLLGLFVLGFVATCARQFAMPFRAFLNGLRKIALSGVGETSRSLLLLGFLATTFYLKHAGEATPEAVMAMRITAEVGGLAVLVVIAVVSMTRLPGCYFTNRPSYEVRSWLSQGLSLMLVAGASVVLANSDILMIGAMIDTAEVGPFHAASRAAELTSLALAISIIPLGPIIARLYETGEIGQLRALLRRSTQMNLTIGAVMGMGFFIFAEPFLRLFGPEFVQGTMALRILVAAQFVNVGVGPVQLLLVMTGYHRVAAIGVVAAAVANVALNAVLIPTAGVEGAAIGTATSVIIWNVSLLIVVHHYVLSDPKEEKR